jgi:hypothetical protein
MGRILPYIMDNKTCHVFGKMGYNYWLVVEPYPSEKYKSVGIMKFPTEWKNNPFMFQTTNQDIHEPP